jgi:hypothetical protein
LLQNPAREASLRELLANLQADVELLLSKASSAAEERASNDASCAEGSAGTAAAESAGFVLAEQLQQQLAKLTQNCAELGEAVLQLDLQLQQVCSEVVRAFILEPGADTQRQGCPACRTLLLHCTAELAT